MFIVLEAGETTCHNRTGQNLKKHSLLIRNFHSLTNKTLFVSFRHMRIKFVVAIEAFSTETTERMDTSFDLFNWQRFLESVWDGG